MISGAEYEMLYGMPMVRLSPALGLLSVKSCAEAAALRHARMVKSDCANIVVLVVSNE